MNPNQSQIPYRPSDEQIASVVEKLEKPLSKFLNKTAIDKLIEIVSNAVYENSIYYAYMHNHKAHLSARMSDDFSRFILSTPASATEIAKTVLISNKEYITKFIAGQLDDVSDQLDKFGNILSTPACATEIAKKELISNKGNITKFIAEQLDDVSDQLANQFTREFRNQNQSPEMAQKWREEISRAKKAREDKLKEIEKNQTESIERQKMASLNTNTKNDEQFESKATDDELHKFYGGANRIYKKSTRTKSKSKSKQSKSKQSKTKKSKTKSKSKSKKSAKNIRRL